MKLVLITGMSGAGKGVALKTLEDSGFEAIDNLPLAYLPDIAASSARTGNLAVTVDIRSRDFSTSHFASLMGKLRNIEGVKLSLLFLDCDDEVLRRRLLERRRERPASGNRADWREKVREVAGVADAFVYPLAMPPASYPGVSTPHTLGCVTVLAVGPANESVDEPVNGRFTIGGAAGPGERCTQIEDYIEGDRDADLNVTTTGRQWRPASLPQGNYCVKTPQADARSFEIQIKNATGSAFPWVYDSGMTVHSSSTSTSLVVNGDHTAKNSKNALVRVGSSVIRGGYAQVNLGVGSYNGGTGLTTWSVADMGGAPIPVHVVLPRPPNYSAVKEATIAYIDSLGPGEYTGSPAASARHPSPDSVSPSAVYLSALAAAVITGVPTVLAATVTVPVADVLPVDEAMVDLAYLTVRSL